MTGPNTGGRSKAGKVRLVPRQNHIRLRNCSISFAYSGLSRALGFSWTPNCDERSKTSRGGPRPAVVRKNLVRSRISLRNLPLGEPEKLFKVFWIGLSLENRHARPRSSAHDLISRLEQKCTRRCPGRLPVRSAWGAL